MHRVDSSGATATNKFTDGDPLVPTPSTVLAAKWHNAVQEEVALTVEAASLTLDDGDDTQLQQAINYFLRSLENLKLSRQSTTVIKAEAIRPGIRDYVMIDNVLETITSLTTDVSSDNAIAADGTDSGSTPSASTLYYIYISNSLASYAAQSIRLSTTAPTNGYLGASGNAKNWRFLGACYLDAATQMLQNWNVCGYGVDTFRIALSGDDVRSAGSGYYSALKMNDVVCLNSSLRVTAVGTLKYNVVNGVAIRISRDSTPVGGVASDNPGAAGAANTIAAHWSEDFAIGNASNHDFDLEYNYKGSDTLTIEGTNTYIEIERIT